ncbi:VCBS repeat-containing protein [bacterium]|nr:VCBS repeat-containing protein [bacterium]
MRFLAQGWRAPSRVLSIAIVFAAASVFATDPIWQPPIPLEVAAPGSDPISAAPIYFDGDGDLDFAVGLATGGGGKILLLTKRTDWLGWRVTPAPPGVAADADAPFASDRAPLIVPVRPDFLCAGDFNNDGRQDLVAGARGERTLHFFLQDEPGGFSAEQTLSVPGRIEAIAVGDVNRHDGIKDLAIAFVADGEGRLLLYESPGGVLSTKPDSIKLTFVPNQLEIVSLGENLRGDLVIAGDHELAIYRGIDRQLTISQVRRAHAWPPKPLAHFQDDPIASIAVADFLRGGGAEIAVSSLDGTLQILGAGEDTIETITSTMMHEPPTRLTPTACIPGARSELIVSTDWIQFDSMEPNKYEGLAITSADAETTWERDRRAATVGPITMRSVRFPVSDTAVMIPAFLNDDAQVDFVILDPSANAPISMLLTQPRATYIVTDPSDSPDADLSDTVMNPPTFRAAIENANKDAAADAISFSLPAGTVLKPQSDYPALVWPVTIDGQLQAGDLLTDQITLDGSDLDDAMGIGIKNNSVVRHMNITHFPGIGLALLIADGTNFVEGNNCTFNEGAGININSDSNTIGGMTTTPGREKGNWCAGNFGTSGQGIAIVGGDMNMVAGNLCGTTRDGDAVSSNTTGIFVRGVGNVIGGAFEGTGNYVAGNQYSGIDLQSLFGHTDQGVLVMGNRIGMKVDQTAGLGNQQQGGIRLSGASGSQIGSTAALGANVIGGNDGNGISMTNTTSDNPITDVVIQGNYVGLDYDEMLELPNQAGIGVGEWGNTVGGSTTGAGNIIAANRSSGLYLYGEEGERPNQVYGNFIGTDRFGYNDRGNGGSGVYVTGTYSVIGGVAEGEGNVICWNGGDGVQFRYSGAHENSLGGNAIGTDSVGDAAQPNVRNGVHFLWGAHSNLVFANTISGNTQNGVSIEHGSDDPASNNCHDNALVDNFIGVNITGDKAMPNQGNGVYIDECTSTTIEGTSLGGCVISGNIGHGIEIRGVLSKWNLIKTSIVGLDETGGAAIPNGGDGILVTRGAKENRIGGHEENVRNIISANKGNGIHLSQEQELIAGTNVVEYNYVGTDKTGMVGIGNEENGILVESGGNFFGGGWYNSMLLVSGNKKNGIAFMTGDASGNTVETCIIGLNIDQTNTIPNVENGILIEDGMQNDIGFDFVGFRKHVIAGNGQAGVVIRGRNGIPLLNAKNQIHNCHIGISSDWDPAGNIQRGVLIEDSSGNLIGGHNWIWWNFGEGIVIKGAASIENEIVGNSIKDNAGLGIDLGLNAVTLNDPLDADVGPNNYANFPVIVDAHTTGTLNLFLSGTYEGLPNEKIDIDFFLNEYCDPSNYGEGYDLFATIRVTTDASGEATFSKMFPCCGEPDWFVTATATDSKGNTSEFSECKQIFFISPVLTGWMAQGPEPLPR